MNAPTPTPYHITKKLRNHIDDTAMQMQDHAQNLIKLLKTQELDRLDQQISQSRTNPLEVLSTSHLSELAATCEALDALNHIKRNPEIPVDQSEKAQLASAFLTVMESGQGSRMRQMGDQEETNVSLQHLEHTHRKELVALTKRVIASLDSPAFKEEATRRLNVLQRRAEGPNIGD